MEMEVALGNPDEVKPKACSLESNSQENGVRDHEMKENANKIESLNDSGVIEDCVMNGVSSLLKMKQAFNEKDAIDEVAEDSEEEQEEEHSYQIGDFVWGKIKNHPWWPGQIYDPLEASDLALKLKQKGRLLVAYFGDGTFAWCHPSQLKSFTENFQECSKISNSKGFISAVQEAVEEMGEQMERVLTHDSSSVNRVVTNAGIKEGVLVHNVRREIVTSLLLTKPAERIIRDVHSVATSGTYIGLLELEVVKRRLAVLYRNKRGIGLSKYQEPQSVPGLEDKNNDDDEPFKESKKLRSLEKCSGFPDNRLQHKKKEKSIAELLENESSAMVIFGEESGHGNGKLSRKKLKRNEEVKSDLGDVSTPKRRRASKVAKTEDSGHEISESKGFSKKKEKESTEKDENSGLETDIDSTPLASLVKRAKNEGDNEAGTQTLKRERKKSKYFSSDYLSDFGSKGRKRSKVDQIESANDDLMVAKESRLVDKPLEDGLSHEEPLKDLSNAVEFLRLGATLEEMCDLIRLAALGTEYCRDSSSRDMVKEFMSIYRSFTYHDEINSKLWILETEKEPKKLKGKEQGEEDTDQPKLKGKQQGEEKEKPKLKGKQQGAEVDTPKLKGKQRGEETEKPKRKAKQQGEETEKRKAKQQGEEKEKPKLKVKQQGEDTDKPKLKAKQQEEEVDTPKLEGKVQGEEKDKPKRKAKEQGEELDKSKLKDKLQREEVDKPKFEGKEQGEETDKPKRKAKQEGEATDKTKRKAKQLGEEIDKPELKGKEQGEEIDKPKKMKKDRKFKRLKKGNEEETEKKSDGVELFVIFGPGSSLPNKEDLIKIYEKFGSLDKGRTYMFYNNFCARVAFLNATDGEKAFEFSQEKCPFGDSSKSTIKFRLKYASKEEKISDEDDMVVAEATMEIEYVKKKLEEMKMLLDESKGGLKEDVKMKFEEEMMNLMEKVKKIRVVGSS